MKNREHREVRFDRYHYTLGRCCSCALRLLEVAGGPGALSTSPEYCRGLEDGASEGVAVQVVRLPTMVQVLPATTSHSPRRHWCTPLEEPAAVQTFLAGCHTVADKHNKREECSNRFAFET
jgi:hypothetical protein